MKFKSTMAALAACLIQSAAYAAAALDALPFALETVAPAGAAAITPQAITLTAVEGTDLYANIDGSEVTDNTPRVLFAPSGDFIFSAKVTAGFKSAFDGGALILYADRANWAKLLFERTRDGKAAISTTVTKTAGDDALHQMIDGDAVFLKIARKGPLYVLYTSLDGATWRTVRAFSLPAKAPVKLGFSAQSPMGPDFQARFSEVRFRAGAFKDYWQGE